MEYSEPLAAAGVACLIDILVYLVEIFFKGGVN